MEEHLGKFAIAEQDGSAMEHTSQTAQQVRMPAHDKAAVASDTRQGTVFSGCGKMGWDVALGVGNCNLV